MSTVETSHGKVEGFDKRGVRQFRGIPYAAAPVGDLRFRPPEPPTAWTGTFAAHEFGPVCPQSVSGTMRAFGAADLPEQDEAACLTLNVWTPACDGAQRPTMVWFHGGSFLIGDGRTPWYDGVHLARERDVVIVTCNYRLGAFGFLHLGDLGDETFLGSGNCGLLDQAAVLEWVHDNVASFGGDPGNVTVFGESAGAMSIATHFGLRRSRGLYHRAITQSGATAHVHGRAEAERVGAELLEAVGLAPARAGELRDLPIERILDAQAATVARHWGAGTLSLPFQPVVDHASLHVDPLEAVEMGAVDGVPLLAGTTRDEMNLFTHLDPEIDALSDEQIARRAAEALGDHVDVGHLLERYGARLGDVRARDLWSAVLTDRVFRLPAMALLDEHSRHQRATYAYRFEHAPDGGLGGALGACHALDLVFGFDNLDAPGAAMLTGPPTDETRALARDMADAWTTFARTGEPRAPGLPEWRTYAPPERATMLLDTPSHLALDPDRHARETWEGTGSADTRSAEP